MSDEVLVSDSRSRPWAKRANTIGVLPGSGDSQLEALRGIVKQMPFADKDMVTTSSVRGGRRRADTFVSAQMSQSRLAERDDTGRWVPSVSTRYWMETGDNLFLGRHIHSNVKLFGELLNTIDGSSSVDDLVVFANSYGLYWSSADQIHRRLSWFRSLGFLEKWRGGRLEVTRLGRTFLESVELALPIGLSRGDAIVDIPPDDPASVPIRRRRVIGYIPKGRPGVVRPGESIGVIPAIRKILELFDGEEAVGDIEREMCVAFGLKAASVRQGIATLRNLGVVDYVAIDRMVVTAEGRKLIAGWETEFVQHVHQRYRFIGELLLLAKETISVPELAGRLRDSYDSPVDDGEVRTRMSLLADAGLVDRVDWTRYRTTAYGVDLCDRLELEPPAVSSDKSRPGDVAEGGSVSGRGGRPGEPSDIGTTDRVVGRLREFGNSADHSEEFEESVAEAFGLLGFAARRFGGSGRTDVVVDALLAKDHRYRVIVEVKASAAGVIRDDAVKFDALKDHRRRHEADHCLLVAPSFSDRVRKWAAGNDVAVLEIEKLVDVVERHHVAPLSLLDLRPMFASDVTEAATVEDRRRELENTHAIVVALFRLIWREAGEEDSLEYGGSDLAGLRRDLRRQLGFAPSIDVIKMALGLLSSPVFCAIEESNGVYKVVDCPDNVANRLKALSAKMAV